MALASPFKTVGNVPFRHYKGGLYCLLFVAETHHHNGDRDAVYISLTTGKIVTRPYERDRRNEDAWTDIVVWPDGEKRPRFQVFAEGEDPFVKDPALSKTVAATLPPPGLENGSG